MLYNNNNIKGENNQFCVLVDKDKKGKERPWREKKLKTIPLAESYERLGMKKSYRVRDCATYLEFKRLSDGRLKLSSANFCQVRLCPMCAFRREHKIFAQSLKVINKALEIRDYRFIFLTLTLKNVYGDDLSSTLDKMFKAFNNMFRRKVIKNAVKGWFRALEITHNLKEGSKDYDTYHPHFHIILMVNKSYFTKPELYISHEKWTSLWKEALKIDYTPVVNIKAVKTGSNKRVIKSVAEISKYTVEYQDYLVENSLDMTDNAVFILDSVLAGRRLVAYGGEFKKIHKELNLDDSIDGDLINTGEDEELVVDDNVVKELYKWHVGYNQFFRIK